MENLTEDFMEIKLNKICRTCLAEEHDLHSIFDFDPNMDNLSYNNIITSVTGIKVLQGDGLPSSICGNCKQSAAQAYQYRRQSEKADLTLKKLICSSKDVNQPSDAIKAEGNALDIKYELSNDFDDNFGPGDFDIASTNENDIDESEIKNESVTDRHFDNSDCQCKICNNILESETALRNHILSCVKVECDDEKISFCPICGDSFEESQTLLSHVCSKHYKVINPKKRGRPKKNLTKALQKSKKKSTHKASENGIKNIRVLDEEITLEIEPLGTENSNKLRCGICNSVFETKDEIHLHYNNHKVNKVLICILCNRMYLEQLYFNRHFYQHHNENEELVKMKGNEDKIVVENKEEIANEVLKQLFLDVAQGNTKKYINEMLMEEMHNFDANSDESVYLQVCSLCGGLFFSIETFTQHNDIEHPDFSHRCNLCLKLFTTTKTAARHRRLCQQIECKHECPTCGLKFAYEMSLNKHILRQHKGQNVSVNFINPKYKDKEKKFACSSCNKSFYRQDLLDRHAWIHLPSEKRYECDICKKKFNRKDNLRSHTRVHDPNREKKPSSCLCLYCGRSFSNSSNLIVHMRRHTGEKPYKCDFCDKGFPRSSDLQCHRRSHTGEKPCLCNICGKGFSRSNKLSRHMRVHTGLRPYKCTYCEKAFSQSNDLTLHIRRHTGDKPYVCDVCGDRFIQGTALHNHRKTQGHYSAATSQPQQVGTGLTLQNRAIKSSLTVITTKKIIDISKL